MTQRVDEAAAAERPTTRARRVPRGRSVLLGAVAVVILVGAVAGGAAALGVLPAGQSPVPRFVEETATSGVVQTYAGPLPYFVGGGIAVLDCDRDGRPDLYTAGGTSPAALFRNVSETGGALRFEPVHDDATDLTAVTGAYPLDIDGDGLVDLAVLRNGENVLLRGIGDCRFVSANATWAFDGGSAPTNAFSATWEADAELPTLAFGNYVDPRSEDPHDLCADNELVRPATDGRRYSRPLPLTPSYCALSMLFSDWDRSGRRDLRVSNDAHYYMDGEEQLWRIEPGEPPRLYTTGEGWVKVNVEGMGIASQDVTGDGYPDVYLTSQGENRLQTLTAGPAQPTYADIGLRRGVNVQRPFTGGEDLPSTAWHPEFDDVNNDGLLDLFVSKGNVMDQADFARKDPSNLLLGQADGTFSEAADRAGVLDFDRGRGAALTDLNGDGLLDLIESHLAAPVRLWRNVGAGTAASPAPMGHWLAVALHQPGHDRDAIGAWIAVRSPERVVEREVTVGGGHASGELVP
ncbi:MAG: FG-GAP repeat domain-containing protein, partial [Chloroflexota bacterium]